MSLRELASEILHRLQQGEDPIYTWDDLPVLLDVVGLELQVATDGHQNSLSHERLKRLFELFHGHSESSPERLKGATVLEIGAGGVNPLALALVQVMLGASHAIAAEPDPIRNERTAALAMARTLSWGASAPHLLSPRFNVSREAVVNQIAGFDVEALRKGNLAGIDKSRLTLIADPIQKLSLPDASVDYVFSNSVLEHVEDVEGGIREMARVCRRGALATHLIDGVDHRFWSMPGLHSLDFLTVKSDAVIVHMCNRVRPLQFAELFEKHGFVVVAKHASYICQVDDAIRARMVEPYRSMDQRMLEVGQMIYHLRRR